MESDESRDTNQLPPLPVPEREASLQGSAAAASSGRKSPARSGQVARAAGAETPRAPAQLKFRRRAGRRDVFVIHDGSRQISTRTADSLAAAEVFRRYNQSLVSPGLDINPQQTRIGELIERYAAGRPDTPAERRWRQFEVNLGQFWENKTIADITNATCKAYAAQRVDMRSSKPPKKVGPNCVRSDLSHLRKIVKAHCKRQELGWYPSFWMPALTTPRRRWLSRIEVAALIHAARGRVWDPERKDWRRSEATGLLLLRDEKRRCVTKPFARLILLGVWTGTRSDAMLRAGWFADPNHPHIEIVEQAPAQSTFYRKGSAEPDTKKRRPPARLCPEILRLVRRWAHSDERNHHDLVLHDEAGRPLASVVKTFADIRKDAGLEPGVSIHTLRHTCATWLLEGGAPLEVAAGYLGLTLQTLERTYAQVDPEFTVNAADELNHWGRGPAARSRARHVAAAQTPLPSRRIGERSR